MDDGTIADHELIGLDAQAGEPFFAENVDAARYSCAAAACNVDGLCSRLQSNVIQACCSAHAIGRGNAVISSIDAECVVIGIPGLRHAEAPRFANDHFAWATGDKSDNGSNWRAVVNADAVDNRTQHAISFRRGDGGERRLTEMLHDHRRGAAAVEIDGAPSAEVFHEITHRRKLRADAAVGASFGGDEPEGFPILRNRCAVRARVPASELRSL